jgi:hypothetical protein
MQATWPLFYRFKDVLNDSASGERLHRHESENITSSDRERMIQSLLPKKTSTKQDGPKPTQGSPNESDNVTDQQDMPSEPVAEEVETGKESQAGENKAGEEEDEADEEEICDWTEEEVLGAVTPRKAAGGKGGSGEVWSFSA